MALFQCEARRGGMQNECARGHRLNKFQFFQVKNGLEFYQLNPKPAARSFYNSQLHDLRQINQAEEADIA